MHHFMNFGHGGGFAGLVVAALVIAILFSAFTSNDRGDKS